MRRIEIDDDIYEILLQNTQEIGESASSILRRLLKTSAPTQPKSPRVPDENLVEPRQPDDQKPAPPPRAPKDLRLQPIINRLDLSLHRTAVDRFLAILGALHQVHKATFHRVSSLGGRNRTYFAPSEKEIEATGSSTQPKQIPNTDFWVVTNNDTSKKQRIIQEVMETLDYESAEAQNIARLVHPDARMPSHWPEMLGTRSKEQDDGKLRI
jgi:negative modulator of initiation of replication